MINAPHGKEFIFQDGSSAKNILELLSKLETLSDHQFHHFVNVHKNDFANWTDHVLENKRFSDKLRTVGTRNETIQLIKDEISDSIAKANLGSHLVHTQKIEDHSISSGHSEGAHHNHKEKTEGKTEEKPQEKIIDKKEEKEEQRAEITASRNWFRLFSKKSLTDKKLQEFERKHEEKIQIEAKLSNDLTQDKHENALWVILYIALVVLILTLITYKLFLS